MHKRAWLALITCTLFAGVGVQAEQIPRTPHGFPDMQGVWHYGSGTPFERPVELGTKRAYTDEESNGVREKLHESQEMLASPSDPDRGAPAAGAAIEDAADRNFTGMRTNLTMIAGEYRTSLITDPPNGRFPYREGVLDIREKWLALGHGAYDGPEILSPSERCLNAPGPMPPMVGWTYNANMRIVQTADHFVIAAEMPFAPRIVPYAKDFQSPGFSTWLGESIASWEEDTLVVLTRNLHPASSRSAFRMSGELEVVERFTLVSADKLFYRYTVTDPAMYTQRMTVEMTITRTGSESRIFEFACHEGNYSLGSILAGARLLESEGKEIGEIEKN